MAGKKQPKGKPSTAEMRNTRQRNMTDGLASIVAIMMRDRRFRDVRMADLEWLVIPAIMAGQWKLAQGTMTPSKGADPKEGGRAFPVAAALWASVSTEIDTRLAKELDKPMMLKPAEWTSGDNIWLIAVPGQPDYVKQLLQHLHTTIFKGKQVKIRTTDRTGKPTIRTLDALLGKS